MRKLKSLKKDIVHSRNMEIATYACDGDSIIVEGCLKDDRLKSYYKISGEKTTPHTVHHMIIRMRVAGDALEITDIESELSAYPQTECPEAAQSLQKIVGWRIGPGFTQKVKAALSGAVGCVHLTALLLAMAPAAVQGFWAYRARKPVKKAIPKHIAEQFLIDTCRVWRREGPLAAKLLEEMAAEK